ncbi:MAG: tRNA (N6-threonylcarbamoyladenosine(37)-N6)-methyltransferase TrmO [Desulfobulbaceae bacterium]|nr:MAG: tRNA (N6-threonylcarbamoyladenosine(37)-N6)-methyltransferase TrmO [Desulfobulbaceae bacterium]
MRKISLNQIGVIKSCFPEKFGIPRQPGLAPSARAIIEMIPPFNRLEMFHGIEQFSHIWVHFIFHQAVNDGWKSTVRPPRLGGSQRMGIFATRSPHRPAFLGMSAVELLGINQIQEKVIVEIGGIDLLDQTPVIDIKPYLSYSDALDKATGGNFANEGSHDFRVIFSDQANSFCVEYEERTGNPLKQLIQEILAADPRPASQKNHKAEYGMILWEINVRWQIQGLEILVMSCQKQGATSP